MSHALLARLKRGELPLDFNWNRDPHDESPLPQAIPPEPGPGLIARTSLVSEDLRDGLHGAPSYPDSEAMFAYLERLIALGIDRFTVGIYPGAKERVDGAIKTLLARLRDTHPRVVPTVLSLTTPESINWLGDCKAIHPGLEATVFLGTAPSRFFVEEWGHAWVLRTLAEATEACTTRMGVPVIGATEHTTQTPPDFLRQIVRAQHEHGATAFCIADTVGVARPAGAWRIVRFVRTVLQELGMPHVPLEWHGHRDMGNDVANAFAAITAGASRIHVVARGIGERAGNTQLEAVLLNCAAILREASLSSPWKLDHLYPALCSYDALTGLPEPDHGPLGRRSHSTSLGIHTAAMLKAEQLATEAREAGEPDLAARLHESAQQIYTAVNPALVGRQQTICIGPWSGTSTVRLAYAQLGGDPNTLSDTVITAILRIAEAQGRELSCHETRRLFDTFGYRIRE